MHKLLSAGSVRAAVAVVICHVSMAFLAPHVAFAQESDAEKAKHVLSLIGSANDKFDANDFAGALKDYQDAYALYPDPSLLYRMGLSAEKLGDNLAAVDYYEKFVDAVPDDKTAKKVRARIDEMRAELPARYQVESSPAEAEVRIGSIEDPVVCTTPCSVDIPAGSATLVFSKDGYATTERAITAVSGERSTLTVTLDEEIIEVSDIPPAVRSSDSISLATYGWIATGIGVAALGTGAVFTVLSMGAEDDVNSYDKRAPGASPSELQGLKDDATSYYDTSVIMYVVGGVLTATGVTLVIVDAVNGHDAVGLRLSPTRDGALVGVGGRF